MYVCMYGEWVLLARSLCSAWGFVVVARRWECPMTWPGLAWPGSSPNGKKRKKKFNSRWERLNLEERPI